METYLQLCSFERRVLTLSPDGYIRLPLASLNMLPFVHLFSECDEDFLSELRAQTIPARLAGFSEWKSDTNPSVSIGWGWFVHSQSAQIVLAPDCVRSNVMLIDAQGYDLGSIKTANLFRTWLAAFQWQGTVGRALAGAIAC